MKRGKKRGKRAKRKTGSAFGGLDQILDEIESKKAWKKHSSSDTIVAPRSELERQIVEIYTQLLKVEQVGVHDSFFDLGGHSLLATQLVARLRRGFEVELPLRVVFESPTAAGLGLAIIEQLAAEVGEPALTEILNEVFDLSST